MSHTVLVTGAAGYIGSHCIEAIYESAPSFLKAAKLVLVDDLSTGHEEFIQILTQLGKSRGFPEPVFFKIDLLDQAAITSILKETRPDAVFHFAAKISVAESVEKPDFYFQNNVIASQNLISAMKESGCTRMVFSSTAAVYGQVKDLKAVSKPLPETTTLAPINPYGKTKLMMEEAIQAAGKEWGLQSVIFRYFNAAGASFSGRLGENHEPETHLIPLLMRAALTGKTFKVFGTHYETRDGSCIRDYIHVRDLAEAHLLGLKRLFETTGSGAEIFNLGTEKGNSVLEVVDAAEVLTGKTIRKELLPSRAGDSAVLIADATKARMELGWRPEHSTMHDILKTVQKWESKKHA